MGNAYDVSGDRRKAIEYYKKGLQISTEIGYRIGVACMTGNLGNAYCSLGEYQMAIGYSEKALQESTEIGNQSGMASNISNLGNAYRNIGEYQKAIEYYDNGLQIFEKLGDRSGIATVISHLGTTYSCLAQYDVGISYLVRSIRFFDQIFFSFVPDKSKLVFAQQYFNSHLILMGCFLSIGRNGCALLVLDLGRAKELHFCIEKQKSTVEKDVLDYAPAIWSQINAGEEKIQIKELYEVVYEGKSDISVLIFAFDMDGFLNAWVFHNQVIFRKLEARLETTLLLIMQLFAPVNVSLDRNSSFYKAGSTINKIPSKKPGQATENASKDLAANLINLSDKKILEKLFQELIGSVLGFCKGKKLIVVPDQSLFFAPFSALIDENSRYLSESYSIQITPSLHTLKCSIEKSRHSKLGFALFVGNPTVGIVSLNGQDIEANDLPDAAEEVKCIAKLFQATPLIGLEATKGEVLKCLSGASIIHIAAHGEPNQGEIMLTPDQPCSSVPKPESYLLTQRDIMSVSVQARLVVLCCCHSGQGKISSEGVIGITRAFLAAGARSVLATLWPIDDYATKEFMEKFYAELCEETSVCEALKRAMNLFQNHEKEYYRSIKIWAPFTIYGEDVKFKKHEIEEIKKKSFEKEKNRSNNQS